MALSMDGTILLGIPVIVERINTEKNRLAEIAMTIQYVFNAFFIEFH